MGNKSSKFSSYEGGFNSVEKWGIGLTICIGSHTPYFVYDIKPIEDDLSRIEIKLDTKKSENGEDEPDFIFTSHFLEKFRPVDKDGKIIEAIPLANGEYGYEIHLKPIYKVDFNDNTKNISKFFSGGNDKKKTTNIDGLGNTCKGSNERNMNNAGIAGNNTTSVRNEANSKNTTKSSNADKSNSTADKSIVSNVPKNINTSVELSNKPDFTHVNKDNLDHENFTPFIK